MCNTETPSQVRPEFSKGESSPVLETVLERVPPREASGENCQEMSVKSPVVQCQEPSHTVKSPEATEAAGESSILGELLEDNLQSVVNSETASSLKRKLSEVEAPKSPRMRRTSRGS